MSDTSPSPGGGLIVPRLTVAAIAAWLSRLPPEYKSSRTRLHINLYTFVLESFLGREWVENNVFAHGLNPGLKSDFGFLEVDFSASDKDVQTPLFRIFDLSEILLNLQMVEGFDDCLNRLKSGDQDQIEATFAELQVAKLLYIHEQKFRFVARAGQTQTDYDYEIDFAGGWRACAEAKCKLESTDIDPLSVKRSLQKARRQLPRDRPGIIFVKVPQHWFTSSNQMTDELRKVTRDFLRSTTRVASVKYYVSHLSLANQQVAHRHATDEIDNPDAAFTRKHWVIFKGYPVPREWDGMPPAWIRLMRIAQGAM